MKMQLELDRGDSLNLRVSGGLHQPFLTSLLPKLVEEGDTVVDVGAHIGYFTVQFAELVGPKGMVVAYEPAPITFRTLRRNLAGRTNTLAIKAAVSNKTTVERLYLCEKNIGDHRLFDENNRKWLAVDAVRLDDALRHLDRLDLLKLDIQGWEGFALEGAKNFVLLMTRKLIFEFWPTGLEKSGYSKGVATRRLLNLLQDAGFGFFDIREAEGRVVPMTDKELMERYFFKPDDSTNAIRAEDFTDILCMREPAEEVMEMLK